MLLLLLLLLRRSQPLGLRHVQPHMHDVYSTVYRLLLTGQSLVNLHFWRHIRSYMRLRIQQLLYCILRSVNRALHAPVNCSALPVMLLLMYFTYVQEHKSKIAELESSNARISHDLADFKIESKGLKNQDLTIKRLEGQLGQLKAQLQSKVNLLHAVCTGFRHA